MRQLKLQSQSCLGQTLFYRQWGATECFGVGELHRQGSFEKICLAVEIKIKQRLHRPSLKTPPIYLNKCFSSLRLVQSAFLEFTTLFLAFSLVYTIPCFVPTRNCILFMKCFLICQVLNQEICLYCSMDCVSLDHIISHPSISNRTCQSSYCITWIRPFPHLSHNAVSPSGWRSCLSTFYHSPLVQLVLNKYTISCSYSTSKSLA